MGIALLDADGVIIQIDRTTDEAPDGWMNVPDDIVCGYRWGNGTFTAPQPDPAPSPATPTEAEITSARAALDALVTAGVITAAARAQMWPPALDGQP